MAFVAYNLVVEYGVWQHAQGKATPTQLPAGRPGEDLILLQPW